MLKLLIVEDSQAMRNLMKSILQDMADEITECGDGAEALPAYTRCRPDLVLMDIHMKEMDGITATRHIKASFPEARIMIVTDFDEALLRAAALQAGACEYVTKENLHDLPNIICGRQHRTAS